jgi:aryl-alcohol dehydrogenase-like predicted oxidoreductase
LIFSNLLYKTIEKYSVSLSNVALRWVLDQETVAGVIVGARLGYKEHLNDNHRVFSFQLDDSDRKLIASIQVIF